MNIYPIVFGVNTSRIKQLRAHQGYPYMLRYS